MMCEFFEFYSRCTEYHASDAIHNAAYPYAIKFFYLR